MLKTREVAEILGISRDRVRHYAAIGALHGYKFGDNRTSHWRFDYRDVKTFLNNHAQHTQHSDDEEQA
jgi:excisionase family DNA binding protein